MSTLAQNLSTQYQIKTDIQHVLDAPDTYIGSVESSDTELFVYDETKQRISLCCIHNTPALYKLFDECIVNARDHVCRLLQSTDENKHVVTQIDVNVHSETGTITLFNDGNGIDVVQHPENKLWIPEMIFGHLRTSTNYNKEEKKIVGGKNGFGIKLVIIWSTYAKIETIDHVRGLLYVQEFGPNLSVIHPPIITSTKKKPYTRVTFTPDYQRLGLQGITSDMVSLLKKRTHDIAAVTDPAHKKIKVSWNQQSIPIKNFVQYIDLYLGPKEETKRVYEQGGERWEYAVAISPIHEFQQVSFVNGIATTKGGKHVEYILLQITKKVSEFIEKKKKIKVNPSSIKEQLWLFLRCDIENPSFDSQTKDYMNTSSVHFGSKCIVSDGFAEKIAKQLGVMDLAVSLTEAKETKQAKKTDGSKTKQIRGIANFVDANFSGTQKSKDCTLILCEGLSAMSGVVSGLSSEDRNTIGIYPLKGKMLNVRGETTKKITDNKEISDIKKILGLESGKTYTMEDVYMKLRYGKVLALVDSDQDGSHIKGLIINMFHSEWPSLTKIPGFLSFMNTPILRATRRGHTTQLFYNDGEYQIWKSTQTPAQLKHWTLKYFKGLGTSTSTEFKEYFANKKYVDFHHTGPQSDDVIDKVFNKKRPDERKTWLENYDKSVYLNTNDKHVTFEKFIDQELIHFSKYDCARSIPSMVDGLKISLRKILFCAFKRNLTQEIKVAQFSGYVSEHSAYHHGETSLNGAIVNMAQDFIGSNNIHLLDPKGQFGCLSPDTPILMWSGEIKLAKDIQKEDKLVGDDGLVRVVTQTTSGVDDMYELVTETNEKMVVNSQHILTLFYEKNMEIEWCEKENQYTFSFYDGIRVNTNSICPSGSTIDEKMVARKKLHDIRTHLISIYNKSKIIDIRIQDYLQLSEKDKMEMHALCNYKSIQWPFQPVSVDPYTFGSNLDNESSSIPDTYLFNCEQTRLELLAGAIDTYGKTPTIQPSIDPTIEIGYENINTILSLQRICQSLGFATILLESNHNVSPITLQIRGNIHEIPTRNTHSWTSTPHKSCHLKKFTIQPVGKNEFVGWSVDGNQRFLLGNFIITHNSRLQGGSDSASERYIFTHLNKITRCLFPESDDAILNYLDDDGVMVEPEYYIPILPFVLINGISGIGTGFSCSIPSYSPSILSQTLQRKLRGLEYDTEFTPFYQGFKGTVTRIGNESKYLIRGKYEVVKADTIRIVELPIETWTMPYVAFLEELIEGTVDEKTGKKKPSTLKDITSMSTESQIDIVVQFPKGMLAELEAQTHLHGINGVEKLLKLTTTVSTTNMHLFDAMGKLHKYADVNEILDAFYQVRLTAYQTRKTKLLLDLDQKQIRLSNRARYIVENLEGTVDLKRKKLEEVTSMLQTRKYQMIEDSYDYLTKMPMDSVTTEMVTKILKEKTDNEEQHCLIQAKSPEQMWLDELKEFDNLYSKYK